MGDDSFRVDAPHVEGGVFSYEVEGGSLHVSLHEDGSIRIVSPKGPEIITVWQASDLLVADFVDPGLDPQEAQRVSESIFRLRG